MPKTVKGVSKVTKVPKKKGSTKLKASSTDKGQSYRTYQYKPNGKQKLSAFDKSMMKKELNLRKRQQKYDFKTSQQELDMKRSLHAATATTAGEAIAGATTMGTTALVEGGMSNQQNAAVGRQPAQDIKPGGNNSGNNKPSIEDIIGGLG